MEPVFLGRREPSSRHGGFKAVRSELQHRIDLFSAHSREPLQELIDCGAILEVFEEGLHRNTGPAEDKSTAHRLW